ncbi:MAG: ORF6N domain-containing protein, partial [Pricia sp.]
IKVNIQIIRVFTRMREVITDSMELKLEIDEIKKKLSEQGKNIGVVFDYLDALIAKKGDTASRRRIGYKSE